MMERICETSNFKHAVEGEGLEEWSMMKI